MAPKKNYFGEKCALKNNDMGLKVNILEKGRINPL
jgi:hypothetical protein